MRKVLSIALMKSAACLRRASHIFPSRHLGGVIAALFLALTGFPSWAVGSNDDEPPTPSETTTTCDEGLIWDDATKNCVALEDTSNDQASLYRNLRELAWAGRLADARRILKQLPVSDETMTYQGFIARKSGDWPSAEAAYLAALAHNPDNLLARSYYGQGLANLGQMKAARHQLSEIRARGGRQSWPEIALRLHLDGVQSGY